MKFIIQSAQNKFLAIKLLKEATGLGLKESKEIIENLPYVISFNFSPDKTREAVDLFSQAGMRIVPLEEEQNNYENDLTETSNSNKNYKTTELTILSYTDKIEAIKALRDVAGFGLKEAKNIIDNLPATISFDFSDEEKQRTLKDFHIAGVKIASEGLLDDLEKDLTFDNFQEKIEPAKEPDLEIDTSNLTIETPDLEIKTPESIEINDSFLSFDDKKEMLCIRINDVGENPQDVLRVFQQVTNWDFDLCEKKIQNIPLTFEVDEPDFMYPVYESQFFFAGAKVERLKSSDKEIKQASTQKKPSTNKTTDRKPISKDRIERRNKESNKQRENINKTSQNEFTETQDYSQTQTTENQNPNSKSQYSNLERKTAITILKKDQNSGKAISKALGLIIFVSIIQMFYNMYIGWASWIIPIVLGIMIGRKVKKHGKPVLASLGKTAAWLTFFAFFIGRVIYFVWNAIQYQVANMEFLIRSITLPFTSSYFWVTTGFSCLLAYFFSINPLTDKEIERALKKRDFFKL